MSMYKFVKGSRLFMQGKRQNNDHDNIADTFSSTLEADAPNGHYRSRNDDDIRAVHTLRNINVDGTTEWERSSKTVKHGGIKSRSSRTVRKVTTITRGEQSVTSESVMSYSSDNSQKYPAIAPDKKNLKFRVVNQVCF